MDAFETLLRHMMVVAAVLCLPTLGVAALAGTAVAILQAATQVQEQTLTLLPKVIAVGALVALFGTGGMHLCAGLLHDALDAIPALVASP